MQKEEGRGEGLKTFIYPVRTTAGQERNVAYLIEQRARAQEIPIKAILVPEGVKGYVFIETDRHQYVEQAIMGMKHVRGYVSSWVDRDTVERFLTPKPMIGEVSTGDVVEVAGGPFRGMKAKIVHVERAKEEVVIELLEASYTLPITIHADYLRIIEKAPKKG